MKAKLITFLGIAVIVISNLALAAELSVTEAWARATIPGMANGAGYASLANEQEQPLTLVKLESPASSKTELHTHQHDNGMMKMVHVPELTLAAGESLSMAPGSYHIMFFDLQQPFKVGDSVPVVMHFADGSRQQINLEVRELE